MVGLGMYCLKVNASDINQYSRLSVTLGTMQLGRNSEVAVAQEIAAA